MPWDVCGLQEVLVSQRKYLSKRLPAGRWYGVGRQDGSNDGEQAAIIVRNDVRVVDWETRWLSDRPQQIGSVGWDARLPRVATVLTAELAGSARQIGVINTHFDHAGEQARRNAASLIAEWVTRAPETAWIVMGDLNATPNSVPLRLLAQGGLRSALSDSDGGTEHGWTGRADRNRIDHILVDRHWQVLSAKVDYTKPRGILPSDHWPVRAVLRLA